MQATQPLQGAPRSTRAASNSGADSRRQSSALLFLFLTFCTSLFFYGTGLNLSVLLLAAVFLMMSLSSLGLHRLFATLRQDRGGQVGLLAVAYLSVSYHWSVSPDNSFAATWVLVALPLTYLIVRSLKDSLRRQSLLWMMIAVLVLALNSLIRFLVFGERAHQPMTDPNNYAALMYMGWIVLVHYSLSQQWLKNERGGSIPIFPCQTGPWMSGKWLQAGFLLASFVLAFSAFATYSRAAVVVVAVALLIWLVLALARRYSLGPLLIHIALAMSAYVLVLTLNTTNIDAVTEVDKFSQPLEERLALIGSALQMFPQNPVFGIGIFCFPLLYPAYRSTLDQDTAGLFVHNDYVQFLVEGGVPLFLLLVGFMLWAVGRFLRSVSGNSAEFYKAGPALAICAAGAHANINFVFYSLSLGVFIGVLAATAANEPVQQASDSAGFKRSPLNVAKIGQIGVLAGLIYGWLCVGYLGLDAAIYGVFQGQKGLPFVAGIRQDPEKALEFARLTQKLSPNRGVPVLGEAMLTAHFASLEPDSQFLKERTLAKFRQAEWVDPWNPQIYLVFSEFLSTTDTTSLKLRDSENREDLLLRAISLDPIFVPAIDALLNLFESQKNYQKRYALLRRVVYPWMLLLKRRDPTAVDRYMDELEYYARATGDEEFQQALAIQAKKLIRVEPLERDYWLLPE